MRLRDLSCIAGTALLQGQIYAIGIYQKELEWMKECYEQGFTLLELMIVVCILGILAVVAIPKFESAMAQANSAKIQMDLKTIDTAIVMYRTQTGRQPTDIKGSLKDYIEDVDTVKPPDGDCFIGGKMEKVPASEYTISQSGHNALCGTYGVRAFGHDTAGSGGDAAVD